MGVFESLCQGLGGAGNGDQMHMVRHQTVTQHSQMMEFGILSQQFDISDAVGIVCQNYLSSVSALRNMMSNVDNHDARQTGHETKISEMMQPTDKGCQGRSLVGSQSPKLGAINWGTSRLSPCFLRETTNVPPILTMLL